MEKQNKDNKMNKISPTVKIDSIIDKYTINMDAYIKNLKPQTSGLHRRVPPPPSIITMIRSISQNTSVHQKTKLMETRSSPPFTASPIKFQTIFNSDIEKLFLQLDKMPKQLYNNLEQKLSSNEMNELYEQVKQNLESHYLPQIKELILKRAFNDKIILWKLMKTNQEYNQQNDKMIKGKDSRELNKDLYFLILAGINDPLERYIVKMKFKAKNYQLTELEAKNIAKEIKEKIKSFIYPSINPIFQYAYNDENLLKILIQKHIQYFQEEKYNWPSETSKTRTLKKFPFK